MKILGSVRKKFAKVLLQDEAVQQCKLQSCTFGERPKTIWHSSVKNMKDTARAVITLLTSQSTCTLELMLSVFEQLSVGQTSVAVGELAVLLTPERKKGKITDTGYHIKGFYTYLWKRLQVNLNTFQTQL